MTYQETMDYLYASLPMFSRIGAAAYKEDLHNTITLCAALNNPQERFRSIHIAGTNGKGSTSHMLAAMLQSAGYKTGLYTSPHLKDFRERIRINGEMISEDFIIEFADRTKALAEAIQPSFFELTVAMAFEYFAREKVDIAVIETGLGGRLDSTNIITPVLSIITNIGYDHMNILGSTLQAIASEKAGIIKPRIPVVIGEYLPETKAVFEAKVAETKAPVYFAQDEYEVTSIRVSALQLVCTAGSVNDAEREEFVLDLNGLYQVKNLRTVLCARSVLAGQGLQIELAVAKLALANVKKLTGLHGRWDVIAEDPLTVLDVAHNEDGMRHVLEQVAHHQQNMAMTGEVATLHLVLGMVKDKEIAHILEMLPAAATYYFTQAQIPRALSAAELQAKAAEAGLQGDVFENVNDALTQARSRADKNDLILVCGSVFLVGEVNLPNPVKLSGT